MPVCGRSALYRNSEFGMRNSELETEDEITVELSKRYNIKINSAPQRKLIKNKIRDGLVLKAPFSTINGALFDCAALLY